MPGPSAAAKPVTKPVSQAVPYRATAVPGAHHRAGAHLAGAVPGRGTQPRRQVRHGRLARRRRGRLGRLGARQRHPGGVIVGRGHVPAARIEDPLCGVQAAACDEGQLDQPASVAALLGVPLRVVGVSAEDLHPFGHYLAQPRARGRVPLTSYRRSLSLIGQVRALGQDGTLEPSHALDRDAGRVRDFLHRFPGPDSCLDLLGSQRALHFDLVLREPGGLAEGNRPEPLVNRQREPRAATGHPEDSVLAVLAHRDEAQFLHRRPFRPGPFAHRSCRRRVSCFLGTFPAYSSRAADPEALDHSTSLSLSGPERQGQHHARHVRS